MSFRCSRDWTQKGNAVVYDRYQLFFLQVERKELVFFSFRGAVWEMWELHVSHLKVLKKVVIGEVIFV